ncbi:hypothetical protein F511_22020 [Dorcoceras hygrometricum]|uniref:Uncharacterized protein n=1 Tax=Dorcoceras hygrometricum TaxID=472368 RepID=A0A2Z7AEG8_9LAMI|nr:hypothetical protein F511_22020 [Dorcoceras hygrometricum]
MTANVTGSFLFLSPEVTFKRIVAKISTEQFSGVPYVLALLNCLFAAWWVPDGFGCLLGTMQLILHAIYCNEEDEAKKPTASDSLEMGLANGNRLKQSNDI